LRTRVHPKRSRNRAENELLLKAGADPLANAAVGEEPDFTSEYGAENAAKEQGHDEALAIVLRRRNVPNLGRVLIHR